MCFDSVFWVFWEKEKTEGIIKYKLSYTNNIEI